MFGKFLFCTDKFLAGKYLEKENVLRVFFRKTVTVDFSELISCI